MYRSRQCRIFICYLDVLKNFNHASKKSVAVGVHMNIWLFEDYSYKCLSRHSSAVLSAGRSFMAVLMALLLCLSFAAQAETFYVSASAGSDSNPGTSSRPFKTIQKGVNALSTSDDLIIRGGDYPESVEIDGLNGTAGDFVEIKSADGELAIIRPLQEPVSDTNTSGIEIDDSNYIRISRIKVDGAYRYGFYVTYSDHIQLLNNITYNTGKSGIRMRWARHLLVDGNDISRAVQREFQECLTFSDIENFIIRNNYVHDRPRGPGSSLQPKAGGGVWTGGDEGGVGRGGEGIDVKDGSRNGVIHNNRVDRIADKLGLYVDSYDTDSFNIEIYNNLVSNSGCGFALSAENGTSTRGLLSDIKVYNNISYNNKCGFYMGNHGGDSDRADQTRRLHDIEIYNNTIYANGLESGGGGIDIANPNLRRLTVRNNIVFNNKGGQIRLSGGLTSLPPESIVENNIVFGNPGNKPAGDNITVDPRVMDEDNFDLRLTDSSPAIDAGMAATAPSFDHDGAPRPQGGAVDIGAYEYGSVADSSPNPPTGLTVD